MRCGWAFGLAGALAEWSCSGHPNAASFKGNPGVHRLVSMLFDAVGIELAALTGQAFDSVHGIETDRIFLDLAFAMPASRGAAALRAAKTASRDAAETGNAGLHAAAAGFLVGVRPSGKETVKRFKEALGERGLTKGGWRLLCRMPGGSLSCAVGAFGRTTPADRPAMTRTLCSLLSACAGTGCAPDEAEALLSFLYDGYGFRLARLLRAEHEAPRLVGAAQARAWADESEARESKIPSIVRELARECAAAKDVDAKRALADRILHIDDFVEGRPFDAWSNLPPKPTLAVMKRHSDGWHEELAAAEEAEREERQEAVAAARRRIQKAAEAQGILLDEGSSTGTLKAAGGLRPSIGSTGAPCAPWRSPPSRISPTKAAPCTTASRATGPAAVREAASSSRSAGTDAAPPPWSFGAARRPCPTGVWGLPIRSRRSRALATRRSWIPRSWPSPNAAPSRRPTPCAASWRSAPPSPRRGRRGAGRSRTRPKPHDPNIPASVPPGGRRPGKKGEGKGRERERARLQGSAERTGLDIGPAAAMETNMFPRATLIPEIGPHGRLPFDEILVADTETTGLRPFGVLDDGSPSGDPEGPDRLCSLSILELKRTGGGWVETGRMNWILDPERGVPEPAGKVNGFARLLKGPGFVSGRRNLAGLPRFRDAAGSILQFLDGRPVAFHNAVFDSGVLDSELLRAGLPLPSAPLLCTKKAYSDLLGLGRPEGYVKGTNLNGLCRLLGVDASARVGADGKELHGAEVDAAMAAGCFCALEAAGWMLFEDPKEAPHRRRLRSLGAASATA